MGRTYWVGVFPWFADPQRGFAGLFSCDSICKWAPVYGCLCTSILTTWLNSLALREYEPFLAGAVLPHRIDKAQGSRGTREWMPNIMPLISDSPHECPQLSMDDTCAARLLNCSFPTHTHSSTPLHPTRSWSPPPRRGGQGDGFSILPFIFLQPLEVARKSGIIFEAAG